MGYKLAVVTPAYSEPVSLTDMKAFLRVTSTADDYLISGLIRMAREYAERYTEKQLAKTQYVLTVDYFPIYQVAGIFALAEYQTLPYNAGLGSAMSQDINYGVLSPPDYRKQSLPNIGNFALPRPPLISVDSVTYLDINGTRQTLDASTYQVITSNYPGYLKTISGWPSTQGNTADSVSVTFTCGFPTPAAVPEIYKTAIKLMASFYYENRVPMAGSDQAISQGVDRLLSQEKQYSL